jgi:hypothetical protein
LLHGVGATEIAVAGPGAIVSLSIGVTLSLIVGTGGFTWLIGGRGTVVTLGFGINVGIGEKVLLLGGEDSPWLEMDMDNESENSNATSSIFKISSSLTDY